MEAFVVEFARYAERAIEAMAVLIIACAAVEAFIGVVRLVVTRAENAAKRAVWMQFAQWLVAGLTFQLAADIMSTTVAPSWQQLGQVGAIAAIRAFLTFTLDREIDGKLKMDATCR